MRVIEEIGELAVCHGGSLVPTMGALHEGHRALIRRAVEEGRPVVVSIFVNPTQFAAGEDFGRYPRCLEADVAAAEASGADFAFAPSPDAVYPPDEEVQVPRLPAVATEPGLEDANRPGHFAGVCQVVARLFDLVRPTRAIFGEKDFQQLRVIEAMVESAGSRWPGLRIVAHETQRDADGLAMSSRNAYIAPEDRQRARGLARALQLAHAAQHPATAEQMMRDTLEAHDLEVDYAVVRDAQTLLPVATLEGPTRGIVAARLGDIRLIDNMPMTIWR